MKKIIQSALAAALLLGANAASAQITFGPKVGLNLSSIRHKYTGSNDDDEKDNDKLNDNSKMLVGASFGLMMNARFGNLAIQPAVTYSMKGGKVDYSESSDSTGSVTLKQTTRLGYLDIPINLVYTTGGDEGFQVFVGPYIGFGIGGKEKTESSGSFAGITFSQNTDENIQFDNDIKEGDLKDNEAGYAGLDYGINAGIGYLISNFQIQAGYGLGLGNLVPKADGKASDDESRNRNIHLTVAYHFGGE